MLDSRSAFGLVVQTPCGPRKSGMPDSVEMPAPVSATTRVAAATQLTTASTGARMSGLELADRPHLDAAFAGGRDLRGDLNRFVQIARVDQIKAGELLLGLGE